MTSTLEEARAQGRERGGFVGRQIRDLFNMWGGPVWAANSSYQRGYIASCRDIVKDYSGSEIDRTWVSNILWFRPVSVLIGGFDEPT